uniref:Uncharacterized protein n=1 Tax=Amphimedon queenslandica TaxID=400682 RepID=A0A1X7T534_AMPQE
GMYSYWSSFHIVCDCVHINTILLMRGTDWFYDSHHTPHCCYWYSICYRKKKKKEQKYK